MAGNRLQAMLRQRSRSLCLREKMKTKHRNSRRILTERTHNAKSFVVEIIASLLEGITQTIVALFSPGVDCDIVRFAQRTMTKT